MEVKINKEIRNYTESMFFGLSMRQFLFSVLACGVAVGLFFLLRGRFGTETLSWMCILGASPFAVMGFVRYNGMTAEQFVWAWIKSQFLMPKKILFAPENLYYEAMKNAIEAHVLFGKLSAPTFFTLNAPVFQMVWINIQNFCICLRSLFKVSIV